MQNRLSISPLQILVLLGVSCFGNAAYAFQMGEVNAQSAIGEPLEATVGLWLSPGDKLQPIRFKIDPDLSYISNTKLTAIVDRMEARLVQSPNGSSYVSISTATPISEPIVAFRLKVYVGDDARMRNLALALTPAPAATRAQGSARESSANQSRPRRSTIGSPINAPTYTVASGDTLWGIAQRLGLSNRADTATLVQEIFAANPHAFVNGNQNRLMLGAHLNLPVGAAASIDEPTLGTDAVVESSIADTQTIATVTQRSPVLWQERNPELAAELEALKQKYSALRSRYNLQSSLVLTSDVEPAPPATDASIEIPAPSIVLVEPAVAEAAVETGLQAPNDSPTVASTALPVVEQKQSESPTTSAARATSADQTVIGGDLGMSAFAQSLNTLWASIPLLLIFGTLFALVALVLLYRITRKVIVTKNSHRAELAHFALESDRKAEVARKAKNRIEMEAEVKRMLDERNNSAAASTAKQPAAGSSGDAGTQESIETTIDINIAHGRYAEAQTLLSEVIAAAPRNYSAKLRLIEVFYMTERIEEFCALAEDLHQNHRSDMADEEWRRVIRMGKIIAPDRTPFSGPREVENPTQAS